MISFSSNFCHNIFTSKKTWKGRDGAIKRRIFIYTYYRAKRYLNKSASAKNNSKDDSHILNLKV